MVNHSDSALSYSTTVAYLVELGALLLELLVFIPDNLAFLFELISEQILQVLPQVYHLTGSELGVHLSSIVHVMLCWERETTVDRVLWRA